jgi:hypothetical protein
MFVSKEMRISYAHFLLRVEEKMRIVMNLLCVAKIYTISLSREWYKYL